MTFKATLTYGDVYYLGNRAFERGKSILISDEEKDQLEAFAVDRLKVNGAGNEPLLRQKFVFEEVGKAVKPDPIEEKYSKKQTTKKQQAEAEDTTGETE